MTDQRLTRNDLSPDQREVYEAIDGWSVSRCIADVSENLLTIGGLAGSGKSTLLGVFAAETKLRVAYCAFTGRAASVLKRKLRAAGCQSEVTTIHRMIYLPVVDSQTEEILGWRKRTKMPEVDLIVVDEASMVSSAMLHDLQSLQRPILAVGDHGQLPPVMDSGDLMKNPNLKLEKIHRQASDNPIIQFAHAIRESGRLERRLVDGRAIRFARRLDASRVIADAYRNSSPLDVGILCWTNAMRIKLNAHARRALNFSGCPNENEIVMCLKNEPPIYNGMRGRLATPGSLDSFKVLAHVEFPEEELPPMPLQMFAGQFNRTATYKSIDELRARGVRVESMKAAGTLFDFGYAMTAHKSQGSQFQHAIVYLDREEQPSSEDFRRWAYTAATRAVERLTILS